MAEIDRFRIVDALFIIGSIITFIADQATGDKLQKYLNIPEKIFKYLRPSKSGREADKLSEIVLILIREGGSVKMSI